MQCAAVSLVDISRQICGSCIIYTSTFTFTALVPRLGDLSHLRYAFALSLRTVSGRCHCCSCCYYRLRCSVQRTLPQVFSPVRVPFPFSSYTLISKNQDIFIGGGHDIVMSHSQPTYVLEFSHARIQLVQTLISTFLS